MSTDYFGKIKRKWGKTEQNRRKYDIKYMGDYAKKSIGRSEVKKYD